MLVLAGHRYPAPPLRSAVDIPGESLSHPEGFVSESARWTLCKSIRVVVLVKRVGNLRKIFSGKRFAASKDQNAQITAKRLSDSFNLVRFHLQLLTRSVVKFFGEEAMSTTHVANGRDEYVQKYRRKRLAHGQLCVTFNNLFVVKSIKLFPGENSVFDALNKGFDFLKARQLPQTTYKGCLPAKPASTSCHHSSRSPSSAFQQSRTTRPSRIEGKSISPCW